MHSQVLCQALDAMYGLIFTFMANFLWPGTPRAPFFRLTTLHHTLQVLLAFSAEDGCQVCMAQVLCNLSCSCMTMRCSSFPHVHVKAKVCSAGMQGQVVFADALTCSGLWRPMRMRGAVAVILCTGPALVVLHAVKVANADLRCYQVFK